MLRLAVICSIIAFAICAQQVPIPKYCYNPPGDTCTWYPDCIEKRHPCPNNNYAMKYAHHFCSKFGENMAVFSSKGKEWVSATRKCLQRVVVPCLDTQNIDCGELKTKAFGSHTCCYLAGKECTPAGENNPSICDVPFPDWLKVFWITKGAFNVFGQNAEAVLSTKLIMQVLQGCAVSKLGR